MPQRICIGCGQLFDMDTTRGQRCPRCQQQHDQARPTRQQRGYDQAHDQERERRLAQWTPGQPCAIGGEPLYDKTRLDLAHNRDRTGWLGLACWDCNRGHRDAG